MKILDINEAAAFLGYSVSGLRKKLKDPLCDIPYKRLAGGSAKRPHYRFIQERLEQYMTESSNECVVDPRRNRARVA